MTFEEEILGQVDMLESRAKTTNDQALKHIAEILKKIRNLSDLQESAGVIQRIIIDSVQDWQNCNELVNFIERYKQKKK
jgi:uncharacterized protein YjgD (DUF1641 family)